MLANIDGITAINVGTITKSAMNVYLKNNEKPRLRIPLAAGEFDRINNRAINFDPVYFFQYVRNTIGCHNYSK